MSPYEKTLQDLVAKVGLYPEEAYHFVREGLSYAVNLVHGPESPAHVAVLKYMARHKLTIEELIERYERGELSAAIRAAIADAGGSERLNRHVSGAEMCWGIREYAQQRWGRLARLVLSTWNLKTTYDFGRLVFAMIDVDLMQKQPSDSIEDFRDVFEFAEVFENSYRIPVEHFGESD
jgi:uncharacterized repeat protein (TIGR04138 family)